MSGGSRQGERIGVLLLQLGTPNSPSVGDVRRYLRAFLMDPRVIDIPTLPRWMLVNLVIAPFRAPRSAHAYQAVWTAEGSPLLVHTRNLALALANRLGLPVAFGMQVGQPGLAEGLADLGAIDRLVVVPLFPQYASATSGAVLESLFREVAGRKAIPAVTVLPPLLRLPGWSAAVARLAEPAIAEADEVVFSYHGLPERQVRAMDSACLQATNCCDRPDAALGYCYRAQCIASTRLIAAELGISDPVNAFQSRLGREPWLGPSLDETLDRLLAAGRRKIVVLTPSFVADCLETLEEIGIRARERVEAAGGSLHLVPCVNASPSWVETLARAVQSATGLA